jgi:hypothetical protein
MKAARWGAMAVPAAMLAGGCGTCVENLDDVEWVDASASGSGGSGGANASPETGGAGSGGAGAQGSGPGGGGAGAETSGQGGECAGPEWSGAAEGGSGGAGTCDWTPVPAPSNEFLGCPDCDLTPASYGVSFDDGWAPFCGFLRGGDLQGDIRIESGKARLRTSCSSWHEIDYAPFLYRRVEAQQEFVVVTHVELSDGQGNPPSDFGHGGGLVVRKRRWPPGGEETYLRLSAAFDTGIMGIGVFFWSTAAGTSVQPGFQAGDGPYDLAFCRKAGSISAWYREGNSIWTQLGEDQPDIAPADQVQVGVEAHAFHGGGIVEATFDALLFAEPGEASCADAVDQLGLQVPAARK